MREILERVESPGTYVTERVSHGYFCFALCSFGPPSRIQVVSLGEECGMQLHDAVVINCKKGQTILKITAQMSSIWAKGCMLMIVCVCYLT